MLFVCIFSVLEVDSKGQALSRFVWHVVASYISSLEYLDILDIEINLDTLNADIEIALIQPKGK